MTHYTDPYLKHRQVETMNFKLATILVLMVLVATVAEGRKRGDLIIFGGHGGYGGGFISTGGKKGGSIIIMGRKRRSVDSLQPVQPIYVTKYQMAE